MEAAAIRQQNRIYLFVNTKSGGGYGKQYLSLSNKLLTYKFQHSPVTFVELVDMFDVQLRKKTLSTISSKLKANKSQSKLKEIIRVIICGGDGTIMWVLQECLDNEIDMQSVIFGILPIGTGNDFSRSLGWGGQAIKFSSSDPQQLNEMVRKWVKAKISNYDIWDVELSTYPNGCFYDVKDQQEIKKQFKIMKKSFSNYCGMGLDARVVYTVQQNRTKYAFLNKVVYGCIGFCNFFRSMKKFEETVDQFSESQSQSQSQSQNQISRNLIKQMRRQIPEIQHFQFDSPIKAINQNQYENYCELSQASSQKKQNQLINQGRRIKNKIKKIAKDQIFFKEQQSPLEQENQLQLNFINKELENMKPKIRNTRNTNASDTIEKKQIKVEAGQKFRNQQLKSQFQEINEKSGNLSPRQVKFSNKSIRMKGGYRGIVALNCPSYMAGLRHVWETNKVGRKQVNGQQIQMFSDQKYNDGLLEFVGFKNQLNLALQRIMRSGAKMTQGEGPFQIKMKQPNAKNPFYQSFIQIDGQSVKVVNLKSISIAKSKKFPNSKIKVMVNQ